MAETLLKDVTKIVFLCMLWYLFSSAANIATKTVISEFPYPQTVSMAHLLVAVCVMTPAVSLFNVEAAPLLSTKAYLVTIVPLALGKVATSVFSHVGILNVPVSYAHTGEGCRRGRREGVNEFPVELGSECCRHSSRQFCLSINNNTLSLSCCMHAVCRLYVIVVLIVPSTEHVLSACLGSVALCLGMVGANLQVVCEGREGGWHNR